MNTLNMLSVDAEEWAELEWVKAQIGNPQMRLIECGPSECFYGQGHLPSACLLDRQLDLLFDEEEHESDSLYFDYLCLQRGIFRDTLCIFYGEENQDFAWKAMKLFLRFGYHRVKILRGGREGWIRRGFPLSLKQPAAKAGKNLAPAEIVSVRCYSHEW